MQRHRHGRAVFATLAEHAHASPQQVHQSAGLLQDFHVFLLRAFAFHLLKRWVSTKRNANAFNKKVENDDDTRNNLEF